MSFPVKKNKKKNYRWQSMTFKVFVSRDFAIRMATIQTLTTSNADKDVEQQELFIYCWFQMDSTLYAILDLVPDGDEIFEWLYLCSYKPRLQAQYWSGCMWEPMNKCLLYNELMHYWVLTIELRQRDWGRQLIFTTHLLPIE